MVRSSASFSSGFNGAVYWQAYSALLSRGVGAPTASPSPFRTTRPPEFAHARHSQALLCSPVPARPTSAHPTDIGTSMHRAFVTALVHCSRNGAAAVLLQCPAPARTPVSPTGGSLCRFMQFNQAITVTLPYSLVVYMVRDFLRAQADASGGTVDEKQVGSRSGVLAGTLSFAAVRSLRPAGGCTGSRECSAHPDQCCHTQCLSSFPWGWASDRIGRKAVIQIGGLGQMLSMLGLGFAGSYPAAIAARFVGGILNGTTGALKTTIAESYTEQQQAQVRRRRCRALGQATVSGNACTPGRIVQVLGYLSFGWGAGTIIGPAAGGFLAQPCDSFPHAFGSACAPGGLLARLPYLLPCLLAAFAALQSVVTVTLFLQESLDRSLQRERLGSRGSALLAFWGGARAAEAEDGDEELELVAFANEGSGGGGVAEAGAPRAQSAHGVADSARHSDGGGSVRKASTRRSLEVSIDLNGVACIDVEDCADRRRSSDVAHASNYGDARDGEAEQLLSPASQRSVASGNSDAPWYTDRCVTPADLPLHITLRVPNGSSA